MSIFKSLLYWSVQGAGSIRRHKSQCVKIDEVSVAANVRVLQGVQRLVGSPLTTDILICSLLQFCHCILAGTEKLSVGKH